MEADLDRGVRKVGFFNNPRQILPIWVMFRGAVIGDDAIHVKSIRVKKQGLAAK
jgi:hypothetical protein